MADYYPLLARALEALPDRSAAMRKAVYDRARSALVAQLRTLDPPLSRGDIDLERRALDAAIERLEVGYDAGTPPIASQDATPATAPLPVPTPVSAKPPSLRAEQGLKPDPAANDASRRPVQSSPPLPAPAPAPAPQTSLAPASVPAAASSPGEAASRPAVALPGIAAAGSYPEPSPPPARPTENAPPFLPEPPRPAEDGPKPAPLKVSPPRGTVPAPALPSATPDDPAGPPPPGGTSAPEEAAAQNGRRRPRIDVVAPRERSRMLRNLFVGSVLAMVIGLIAVAAFLLRDKPVEYQPDDGQVARGATESGDAKFSERVGGEALQQERPAVGKDLPPAELAVAQRATLIEEVTGSPNGQPSTVTGRAVWRLESVSGGQGQPLETAVVADVTFPNAGLTLTVTIQRNLDTTLPASHTVKLVFAASGSEGERRSVQDIGLLQAKDDESARGSPVAGLPVRVRENLFLIGLSSLSNDIERNTDLLLHRNWFDVPVKYASGPRAIVTFEKGTAGAQILQRAFNQWR